MNRLGNFRVATPWHLAVLLAIVASLFCVDLSSQNTRPDQRELVKALNEKLTAAKASSQTGNFDSAVRILNEAIQLDSTRDLVWAHLGEAYANLAGTKAESDRRPLFLKAADAYGTAIKLKPSDPNYLGNYAIVLGKAGKTAEARAATEQAVQLDQVNAPRYFLNLGNILFRAGQSRAALNLLQKVPSSATQFKGAQWLMSEATVAVYLDSAKTGFRDLKGEKVATDADVRAMAVQVKKPVNDIGRFTIWKANLAIPGSSCSIEERLGSNNRIECAFNEAATVDELRPSYETLISMVQGALGSDSSTWTSRNIAVPSAQGLKHVMKGSHAEVQIEIYYRDYARDELGQQLRLPYQVALYVIASSR